VAVESGPVLAQVVAEEWEEWGVVLEAAVQAMGKVGAAAAGVALPALR